MSTESVNVVVFGSRTADMAELESWRHEPLSVSWVPMDQSVGAPELGSAALLIVDAAEQPLVAVAECARVRARAPALPIAYLGRGLEAEEIAAARRAGATFLLSRPLRSRELLVCIQKVHAGRRSLRLSGDVPGRTALGDAVTLDRDSRQLFVHGRYQRLSASKFDLLCYFVQHSGRAIAATELVQRGLLRPSQRARFRSVIRELRSSIGPARTLLQTVPGYGYRLDLPPPSASFGRVRSLSASSASK
jgi:DNA-binding response OmpR family regulator